MNFWFTIKEGLKGFARARVATTITITSIAFALLLIGYFMVFALNIDSMIGDVRSQFELEVFLEPALSEAYGIKIKNKIAAIEGIESVEYISKEQAAKRFEKEFGRSVFDVLETNPLPATCKVRMKEGFQTSDAVNKLIEKINDIENIDDVVYQKDLLSVIDRYINYIYLIAGSIGVLLAVIAVILLYNTVRLTIFARSDIIEIMKLVGATSKFIRRPFIVEGFMQGLIGSILAGLLLFISYKIFVNFIYPYAVFNQEIYLYIIISGILIGLFSSRLSVSKYLS
jgi:cell division transport system permease protein